MGDDSTQQFDVSPQLYMYGCVLVASFPSASRISIARVAFQIRQVASILRTGPHLSQTSLNNRLLLTTSPQDPIGPNSTRLPFPEGLEKEMSLAECAQSFVTLLIADTEWRA